MEHESSFYRFGYLGRLSKFVREEEKADEQDDEACFQTISDCNHFHRYTKN